MLPENKEPRRPETLRYLNVSQYPFYSKGPGYITARALGSRLSD